MKNRVLLNLLSDFISCNDNEEICDYIMKNHISNEDLKKVCLVLLNKELFDYISCYNYEKVIDNIDNKNFMENEDNFF